MRDQLGLDPAGRRQERAGSLEEIVVGYEVEAQVDVHPSSLPRCFSGSQNRASAEISGRGGISCFIVAIVDERSSRRARTPIARRHFDSLETHTNSSSSRIDRTVVAQ
jgi:hypothetical protein